MKLAKSIELMGKRWNILLKLSEKKRYVSELAKELKRSTPQISKELKELEESELVESLQEEGERLKYYRISEFGNMIFGAINQATERKEKEKLEEWQVNEFLSILEDQNLSENLRLSFSESFHDVCKEHPIEVISHSGVRRLFEKVAADRLPNKITEGLNKSLLVVLPHASRHENWSKWVSGTLYPVFLRNMKDENEGIRLGAIQMVGIIARLSIEPSAKDKAEEKLLEVWFSSGTDPNSELGKEVLRQLEVLPSKRLFDKVRGRAKNKKEKAKAEALLKKLKECLMPKSARDKV